MKRKRHTEEQIIAILKEHEAGMNTADLCRKHGISEASFYNWKANLDRAPFNLRIIALLAEVDVDRSNPLEGQLRTWLVDTKASTSMPTNLLPATKSRASGDIDREVVMLHSNP
jgi:hypothetical protein